MELRELCEARDLAPDVFAVRFGEAFLVLSEGAGSLSPPDGPEQTGVIEIAPGREPAAPTLDSLVLPVKSSGRSLFSTGKLAVGRTANNDVHIPDRSVSRYHAVISRDADGGWVVHDAGTRAGTMVDGRPAPTPGVPGLELRSGAHVVFGGVSLQFFDLDGVRALLADFPAEERSVG